MSYLVKPVLTEKSTQLSAQGRYTFWARVTASKLMLKKEIELRYGVKVQQVNTMTLPPKRKRRYMQNRVIQGFKPIYKKVIVTLQEGDMIDFYADGGGK